MIESIWALIPALLILTALALIWAGLTERSRGTGGDRRKAMLMIVAGVVFLGNAAILIGV